MKKVPVFLLVLFVLLAVNSCADGNNAGEQSTQVAAIGNLTKMKQFVDVNVIGSMQVFYTQESKHTVRVDAQKEAFDKLVIYVQNNELYITSKNKDFLQDSTVSMSDVKVYVTSPSLREVSLTGEGGFTASTNVTASHLDIDLTGSGEIVFEKPIDSKTVDVNLTGSGVVNIADLKSPKLWTQITGSGDVNYAKLKVENAESVITGSGKITMKGVITGHSRKISGSGEISVTHLN